MITKEQLSRHAQGFGGSDAKIFEKVGRGGLAALTASDKKRIAQALGRMPLTEVPPTPAMQKGHDFEAWMAAEQVAKGKHHIEQEVELTAPLAKNFDTFAHADFFHAELSSVFECKCTKDPDINDVAEHYRAQLQWYYLMGVRTVSLMWHPSTTFEFSSDLVRDIDIERDETEIEILRAGIKIIDEAITAGDNFALTEWTSADLLPYEEQDLAILSNLLRRVKDTEKQIDEFRARLLKVMEENSVTKITATDGLTVTYVGATTARTFDKKALAAAHPEIDLTQFEKETKRSAYIKFS